jgi:hypothetical protein
VDNYLDRHDPSSSQSIVDGKDEDDG